MSDTAPRSRLHLVFFVAVLLLAALFFWPAGVDDVGPVDPTNTLHRGLNSAPESYDRQQTSSVQASDVFRDIGEGLVSYTATGELTPGAAETWTISRNGLVYTFTLRENGRWSSGDAVTAEDFVFTFRRLFDPDMRAPYAGFLSVIENAEAMLNRAAAPDTLGVRALDPQTLEITLAQPTPYFLSLLTHPSTHPQHAASIAALGDDHLRAGNLVTNGAYRLAAVEPGALIELERNPHYWNDAATAIDRVHYHILVEPMAEYNRFRAGELHITSTLPPSIAAIRERYPDEIRLAPSLGVYYYGFNVTRPPFENNKDLRQALSLAIDRAALAEQVLGRGEVPAYSFVPPGIEGYEPPELEFSGMSQAERNEHARRLYERAGYGPDNHVEFELRYNTGDDHQRIAEAVQSMWREVLGVEVTLVNVEFQVLLSQMRAREVTEIFRSAWNGDYADAHTFLSTQEADNPQNLPGWSSADYDEWMRRAGEQADEDTRLRYLEEAERTLLQGHAVAPLYYYVSKHLVSEDVVGWEDNVLDIHYSQHLALRPATNGN